MLIVTQALRCLLVGVELIIVEAGVGGMSVVSSSPVWHLLGGRSDAYSGRYPYCFAKVKKRFDMCKKNITFWHFFRNEEVVYTNGHIIHSCLDIKHIITMNYPYNLANLF